MTIRMTRHIDEVISLTSLRSDAHPDISDDPIVRSWRRCVNDHGLDPTRAQPARVLESWQVREHQEQIESFMRVARAGMEQLYKRVSPLGYVLLLTDSKGITVDCIGNDLWDRELRRSGLCLGADWNESRAGTCGVGTCIVERAPLTCHQEDHFDATHIGLTCTTAPLFDPTGEFIGVLDISALTSPSEKPSQHLARHMTVMYAKMVEDANFIRHFSDRWILRLDVDWALVEVSGECLLAFDVDGVIVGANTGARRLLSAGRLDQMVSPLVGNDLPSVFKVDMAEVWRMSRLGTTSERTVLSTHMHELFYAMVSPPRHFGSKVVRGLMTNSVQHDCPALDNLAGEDTQMQRLIDQAKRLVNKKVNILLHGETGTGKELVARALHESSQRAKGAFVAVNCASIPESLIESELFGYASGSFTGARGKGARGLIQQSSGGTLFLDEIGDMPLPLQTRLLRVLSEGEVMPLGTDKPVPVELTVVAASHRDLRRLIAEGAFREDLYYRLCGATLHLPPLRLRSDKGYVIDRVLQQEAQQVGMSAKLSDEAEYSLMAYDWPGNIRQLRNVLRYALALSDDGFVEAGNLPQELFADERPAVTRTETVAQRRSSDIVPQSERTGSSPDAQRLIDSLRQRRWNVTATAQDLGICRATVYRQMKRHNIVPPTHL